MKHNITLYLVSWIIKLKGYKKNFSQVPLDYNKLRKEDMPKPQSYFFKKRGYSQFKIKKTEITAIENQNQNKKLILFLHGGAFIYGPTKLHWDAIEQLLKKTDYGVWQCNYPKAPEHNILEINANIDAVYEKAVQEFGAENIILLGDSAGGSLALTLTQRLIHEQKPLPEKVIVISPVVDAAFSNPEIDAVDKKDLILSKQGVISAKKMTLGEVEINDKMISPIYGCFKGFPKFYLFFAEHDITFPDQLLLAERLKNEAIDHQVIIGKNMPHIWPYLPLLPESKKALNQIIEMINA